MISLKNVTKIYSNNAVGLRNISLEISSGEFVFVVGTSGSGKSTLIHLLLKEIDATSGEIFVNKEDLSKITYKKIPFLRRKIGTVFQDFRLMPNKTVYENVAFAMQVVEASPREIRRNVPMVLALVGLSKKSKAYPSQLSGGEQQRAALARAIVNSPPILLADEPTGNLDPETAREIFSLLNDINKRGTTVVIASHDREVVNEMKKRVITIQNGEIVRDIEKGGYGDED